jgi:hypothetical protein
LPCCANVKQKPEIVEEALAPPEEEEKQVSKSLIKKYA